MEEFRCLLPPSLVSNPTLRLGTSISSTLKLFWLFKAVGRTSFGVGYLNSPRKPWIDLTLDLPGFGLEHGKGQIFHHLERLINGPRVSLTHPWQAYLLFLLRRLPWMNLFLGCTNSQGEHWVNQLAIEYFYYPAQYCTVTSWFPALKSFSMQSNIAKFICIYWKN